MTADRLGAWSSAIVAGVGVAYVVVLAAGMARHGFDEPIGDPILAIMEVLTIVSAVPIVTLIAALHDRASPGQRVYGRVALAFATLFAGATSGVHFVELTAGRQLGEPGLVWPSRTYAVELLAWDVFLGLALLSAAGVLEGGGHERGHERSARRGLVLCGGLCLAGAVGPLVGNMRLQLVGVAGYAVVLPVVALLLLRVFRGARSTTSAA